MRNAATSSSTLKFTIPRSSLAVSRSADFRLLEMDIMSKSFPGQDRTLAKANSREWIIGSGLDRSRDWLKNSPECPDLKHMRIVHLGVAEAHFPYEVVRSNLSRHFPDEMSLEPLQARNVAHFNKLRTPASNACRFLEVFPLPFRFGRRRELGK